MRLGSRATRLHFNLRDLFIDTLRTLKLDPPTNTLDPMTPEYIDEEDCWRRQVKQSHVCMGATIKLALLMCCGPYVTDGRAVHLIRVPSLNIDELSDRIYGTLCMNQVCYGHSDSF